MGHRGSMATFRRSHGLLLLCTCVGVQASQYGRSCYNGTDGTYPENKDAAGNIQPGDSLLCASERTVKCENSLLYTKLGRGYAVTCLESPYRPDCASGFALPLEQAMGRGTMGFLYFIAMCYCFLGIAIISDIFMESIEEITAQTKEITVPHDDYKAGKRGSNIDVDVEQPPDRITVQVWNETVANLSLMALGSSAPEIMLAVVEQYNNMMYGLNPPISGKLGASTIVGSAAFNLLCITGIVVSSVGDDKKKIDMFGVFLITAFFSIVIYGWMVFVLQPEPDKYDPSYYGGEVGEVTLWEGLITLVMMPIMIFLAWAQDNQWWGKCCCKQSDEDSADEHAQKIKYTYTHTTKTGEIREAVVHHEEHLSRHHGKSVTAADAADIAAMQEETAALAAKEIAQKKAKEPTRLEYRINASRKLAGKKRALLMKPEGEANDDEDMVKAGVEDADFSTVNFQSSKYEVMEDAGTVEITLIRTGATTQPCWVQIDCEDITANGGEDYELPDEQASRIAFAAGETCKTFPIVIITDDEPETDETFKVFIKEFSPTAKAGHVSETIVTILDDDKPGTFGFEAAVLEIDQADGELEIFVERKNGVKGEATVDFDVIDGSATRDEHYIPNSGTLTFEDGCPRQSFKVYLRDPPGPENDTEKKRAARRHSLADGSALNFRVQLNNPFADVKVIVPDGNKEITLRAELDPKLNSAEVVLVDRKGFVSMLAKVNNMLETRFGKQFGSPSWGEQFSNAVTIGGEVNEDGEEEEPSCSDYFMHFLAINWKVVFALVPPTEYCRGWCTFWVSIAFIGVLTGIVGEFAKLFGCCVGLTEPVIAISFVALGTSLPDTFASMTAASEGTNADAAIGNVTGSNSVNVMLGLGLPWVMASLYFMGKDEKFLVFVGDVSYSVLVYTIMATICVCILFVRRFAFGAELGGPAVPRMLTSIILVAMWIVYIVLSAIESQRSAAKVW